MRNYFDPQVAGFLSECVASALQAQSGMSSKITRLSLLPLSVSHPLNIEDSFLCFSKDHIMLTDCVLL